MAAPASTTAPGATSKPVASPSASATASTASSLHSQPDAIAPLPPAQQHQQQHSGGSSLQAAAEALLKPKKPTMTSRLSSMLGIKESSAAAAAERNGEVKAVNGTTTNGRPQPSRQASITKKEGPNGTYKRFWANEDGTHEHHLRVAKRQEKLSDMFQNLMLGKKKGESHEDQPLSLMSNWVDVMRNEKEKLAEQKNTGNHLPQTLVQKYGKCQEVVGRGAFGIVRVAHKQDPKDSKREQLYAVKEFKQRPGESAKRYQKRLTSEFCISSSMQHPNVITTLDLLQDEKGTYCEVMEYCSGGDLYTLVLAAGQLEVIEADCFFKQLMRGVEYMHEMGVAHRDLKPENLLLTTHGSIKITDFGNGECFRMAWEKEAHMTAGLCGSAPYIAPEEYVDKEFDPRAVDVWACGIIYMAMRTGRHLWRVAQKGEDEFFDRYLEDRKEEEGYRPIEVLRRRQCRNVIYSILDPIPARRLTAHQVLASEWVSEIKVCRAGENLSHSLPPMKRYRQQEQEEERSEKRYRHEVAAEQQEGEGANCLMLLSRADSSFEPETTQSANRMYECKTCSRSFPSFQALGGHRASHKKPKGSGDCSSISNQLQSSKTKPKVHECSICGSEFAIGQALGGHMRRHRSSVDRFSHASPVVKKSNSRRVLCIDLNLPPLEDDLQLCSKGFSGGFLERVAMVDCFN